ncbi:hypothetical protein [Herpetosiphon gulosus]|uniref:GerMN domain-containing protein n=1 Tax=Herpetosiphon gulosus TaxID=1973496 RepID=A0ABP9WVT3_9CHLR
MPRWIMFSLILMLTRGCVNSVPIPTPLPEATFVSEPTQTLTDQCVSANLPPQPLQPKDEAFVKKAFIQTEIAGEIDAIVTVIDTNCTIQYIDITYHFMLDVPDNADRGRLEEIAHRIQDLVLELKQHPPLDIRLNTLVITWRFAKYGCSWGYDYAMLDGVGVWYPTPADLFLMPSGLKFPAICAHTEVVESTIPRPVPPHVYPCSQQLEITYLRLRNDQQAITSAAFEQWNPLMEIYLNGIIAGTSCFYDIVTIQYSLRLNISDDTPVSFVLEQTHLLTTTLELLRNHPQLEALIIDTSINWYFSSSCVWSFDNSWKDGEVIVQSNDSLPPPCVQP